MLRTITVLYLSTYGLWSLSFNQLTRPIHSAISWTSVIQVEKFYWCDIPDIWAAILVELRMMGTDQGWSTALKLLQKCVCETPL